MQSSACLPVPAPEAPRLSGSDYLPVGMGLLEESGSSGVARYVTSVMQGLWLGEPELEILSTTR